MLHVIYFTSKHAIRLVEIVSLDLLVKSREDTKLLDAVLRKLPFRD